MFQAVCRISTSPVLPIMAGKGHWEAPPLLAAARLVSRTPLRVQGVWAASGAAQNLLIMLADARRRAARQRPTTIEGNRQTDHTRAAFRQALHDVHGSELRACRKLRNVIHRAARHALGLQRGQPMIAWLQAQRIRNQGQKCCLVAHTCRAGRETCCEGTRTCR